MLKLLKKDLTLCMHPCTLIFLSFAAMVFIPSYPYSLIVFYSGMALFFTCLTGRENKDVLYSLLLPVAKQDVVKARMLYTGLVQAVQTVLIAICCPLSQSVNALGNQAGMRANFSFVAWVIIQFAIFNAVFFGIYYRNVQKVGAAFVSALSVLFFCIVLEIVCVYAVPFVRDVINSKDPEFLGVKGIFFGIAVLIYAVSYFLTQKSAIKHFEAQNF